MEKKYFILDTNVLLDNPDSIFQFEDNIVVIPNIVLEEVDRFKKEQSDRGTNAREVNRIFNKMELEKLSDGIAINKKGGKLKVQPLTTNIMSLVNEKFIEDNNDNTILATALMYQETNGSNVIIVSNDVNLRIRAGVLKIKTAQFEYETESMYSGSIKKELKDGFLSDEDITKLYQKKPIESNNKELYPNQFITFKQNDKDVFDCIYKDNKICLVDKIFKIWSIKPRSKEQEFAFKLLMDQNIDLVSLIGKAGTGKTLLALAAGLEQVVNHNKFNKIVVARPTYAMGPDLGYLPGSLEEKIEPWMKPIFDALDVLFDTSNKEDSYGSKDKQMSKVKPYEYLLQNGTIEIEALQYIRGRTLTNQYIIIDESQNLTRNEIKTIVTRLGEGSKIIFTGDVEQIDNPYLTRRSCGLSYINNKFKQSEFCGSIVLPKNERSKLSGLASQIL